MHQKQYKHQNLFLQAAPIALGLLAVGGGCSLSAARRQQALEEKPQRILIAVPKPQFEKPRGPVLLSDDGSRVEGFTFGYGDAKKQDSGDYRWSWQFPDKTIHMGAQDDADARRTRLERQDLSGAAKMARYEEERRDELRRAVHPDTTVEQQCQRQLDQWNAKYSFEGMSAYKPSITGDKYQGRPISFIRGISATADGELIIGKYMGNGPNYIFLWQKEKGFTDIFTLTNATPEETGAGDMVAAITPNGKAIFFASWKGAVWLYDPNRFGNPKQIVSGKIKTMQPGKWLLSVTTVTQPNGKTVTLNPARNKVILLSKEISVPVGVKVSSRIAVRGRDSGKGKPMTAESVEAVE